MAKKIIKTDRSLYHKDGSDLCFVGTTSQGKLCFSDVNSDRLVTTDRYGYKHGMAVVFNEPKETVEILSLYPDGNVYRKGGCCPTPVQSSIYGVENLIQIKLTKRGGRIIKKEFC